jgi:hypothetical protein
LGEKKSGGAVGHRRLFDIEGEFSSQLPHPLVVAGIVVDVGGATSVRGIAQEYAVGVLNVFNAGMAGVGGLVAAMRAGNGVSGNFFSAFGAGLEHGILQKK